MRRFIALAIAGLFVLGAATPVAASGGRSGPTIADAAVLVNQATGEFDHLIAAADRAGLVNRLDRRPNLTLFAPTDAAFEQLFVALGVEGVEDIPVDTLRTVLRYHLVRGDKDSGEVLAKARIRTLAKVKATPSVQDGVPYIDEARIVVPDIDVRNGRIHVIDAVIIPGD
jgi:transforming growth factor-beta-induced protein